jgi:glycosyltransferase involved in cell wall biosynthesis
MRVALASRFLASGDLTGEGAQTALAGVALARAGHQVHLVSAQIADAWRARVCDTPGLTWHELAAPRPRHLYFAEQLEYADRVYDSLRALHAPVPLDVVELPDAGGEAVTLLRAKRLLGEFPATRVVVRLQPTSRTAIEDGADRPLAAGTEIVAQVERYTRIHADLVLSAGAAQTVDAPGRRGPVRRYIPAVPGAEALPASRAPGPPTVVWLGQVRPGCGLETLLRAAPQVARRVPGLRVVVRGADSPSDPFGRSYGRYLRSRHLGPLSPPVDLGGPLTSSDLDGLPPAGSPCVVAARDLATPGEILLAVAVGFAVTVPTGGLAADVVPGLERGAVPEGDCDALAETLVAALLHPDPDACRTGRDAVLHRHALAAVAWSRLDTYADGASSRDGGSTGAAEGPVSVVVPVYDQGAYLPATLESLRRSGVEDLDVVVVDDGSTDPGTVAVLDAVATSGAVSVLRCPHRGLSAARNAGLRRAVGDVVLVLDADDLIEPGFLPAAVAALRARDELAFLSGYVRYFGLLDLVYVPAGPVGELGLVLHTSLKSMVLYRRDAVAAVGGYDEALPAFEDWELQLRLQTAGHASDVVPVVGQLYRRHAGSMSFTTSNGMRSELVQYLVRKHARDLPPARLTRLVQVLVDLWKTGYEPSASVLLQQAEKTLQVVPGYPPDNRPAPSADGLES